MLKLNELKEVAKMKVYKSTSEDELLSALISSKPVRKGEPKNKFF